MGDIHSLSYVVQSIEQTGISIDREVHRFVVTDVDLVFPFMVLSLCLRGSARSLYDMQEMTQHKNVLGLIMPGHIMRPIECSDDYTYARLAISPKLFDELRASIFSHDYQKFDKAPLCELTDEQAQRLQGFMDQLAAIANIDEKDLPHRHQILLAQLAVGYEFLNYYRREQDQHWSDDRNTALYSRFCELVVQHYKESREVKYYADLLNLSPKHFTKLIRATSKGVSPAEWIEQYVITQAKRTIEMHPLRPLKQTAFQLGFSEPTSFYRYFKHATGMTAKEYKLNVLRRANLSKMD